MSIPRSAVALALAAVLGLQVPARAQVASALLVEDDPLPGGPPGHMVGSLNNTAVNHVGGYAVTVNSSDGVGTLSHVWGDATGGVGTVLRSEGTFGDLVQSSYESFYGISDSGQVAYSATCENTSTGSTGLDSVWLDDAPVAVEEEAASLPGQFWSFGSRPGVTAGGTPYFVGGITDSSGGGTQNRGLFFSAAASPLILGGDAVPNLPFVIDDANSVSFDYRLSADGNAYLAEVQMESGSSSNDNAMVMTGAGLLLGGGLVREGDPVPAAIGGLAGERWDNFDFTGITEGGKWFFTGDTDGDSSSDEVVVVDGQIVHREGDVLDGEVVSGSIEGAFMNEQGDLAFIWDVDGGSLEALFVNGELLLTEGDEVDLDGDGAVDAGATVANFTGISSLTVGDRDPVTGEIDVYFTADIDTEGTSTSSDDVEGFFRLTTQGAECFLVMGPGPGSTTFLPGPFPFTPQVGEVTAYWAILLDDIPVLPLPAAGGPVGNLGVVGAAAPARPASDFAVQVLMYNPWVFPEQPYQWTPGLAVSVLPGGRVATKTFGDTTGMGIEAELVTLPDGSPGITFPFSIPGMDG